MKFKSFLKIGLPIIGISALSVTLPLALTSCSDNKENSTKPITITKDLNETTSVAKGQNFLELSIEAKNNNKDKQLSYQWFYKPTTSGNEVVTLSHDNLMQGFIKIENNPTATTSTLKVANDIDNGDGYQVVCAIYEKENEQSKEQNESNVPEYLFSNVTTIVVNEDEVITSVDTTTPEKISSLNIGESLTSLNDVLENETNIVKPSSEFFKTTANSLGFNEIESNYPQIQTMKLVQSDEQDNSTLIFNLEISLNKGYTWSVEVFKQGEGLQKTNSFELNQNQTLIIKNLVSGIKNPDSPEIELDKNLVDEVSKKITNEILNQNDLSSFENENSKAKSRSPIIVKKSYFDPLKQTNKIHSANPTYVYSYDINLNKNLISNFDEVQSKQSQIEDYLIQEVSKELANKLNELNAEKTNNSSWPNASDFSNNTTPLRNNWEYLKEFISVEFKDNKNINIQFKSRVLNFGDDEIKSITNMLTEFDHTVVTGQMINNGYGGKTPKAPWFGLLQRTNWINIPYQFLQNIKITLNNQIEYSTATKSDDNKNTLSIEIPKNLFLLNKQIIEKYQDSQNVNNVNVSISEDENSTKIEFKDFAFATKDAKDDNNVDYKVMSGSKKENLEKVSNLLKTWDKETILNNENFSTFLTVSFNSKQKASGAVSERGLLMKNDVYNQIIDALGVEQHQIQSMFVINNGPTIDKPNGTKKPVKFELWIEPNSGWEWALREHTTFTYDDNPVISVGRAGYKNHGNYMTFTVFGEWDE